MGFGDLIILNGTSSVGKSTTVRALQALMDEPYLHSGPDHFLHHYHPKLFAWRDDWKPQEVVTWLITTQGNQMVDAQIGPEGRRILTAVYRAIATFIDAGLNVIVEDALWRKEVLQTAVSIFQPYNPLFVGLHCPLAVAQQREIERGNRFLGGAATFHAAVHAHTIYDFEIDTSLYTPEVCAEMIKRAAENGEARTAVRQLHAQFLMDGSN